MNNFVLFFSALIPVVLLCWYIYSKDRIEKEPVGLLLTLLFVGAAVYFPVIFLENNVIGLIDQMFASEKTHSLSGYAIFNSERSFAMHSAACAFGAIALVEEVTKWLLLFLITHRNKDFDHLFDGVVYAVFLSLGFAAAENVFYALRDGWGTFILRSITSVPGQMIFGVLMGYFYTMWHMYFIASKEEKELAEAGEIAMDRPFNSNIWIILSCVLPIILHGCYSFLHFFTSDIMTIVFYVFLIILYIFCFIGIYRLSSVDSSDKRIVEKMIKKKYPQLYKSKGKFVVGIKCSWSMSFHCESATLSGDICICFFAIACCFISDPFLGNYNL